MEKILTDKELYNKLVKNAYEDVQNYDNSIIIRQIFDIYKKLI